jgi:hypothetical protein
VNHLKGYAYIVYIDTNLLQAPGDDIDSVWMSKSKAAKRCEAIKAIYGEDHVLLITCKISK